jgi:putative transposase
MVRPLRLEFAGALYHITSRGDHREDIFLCDADRVDWLDVLGTVCARFNWVVHAFCQMTNHYHVLLETVDGNLSRGMRQLNGLYTQCFNRRHGLVGHLFQGRYKAILVQRETYLLELSRYVVLNPLRANMVRALEDWQWSSYPSVLGKKETAPLLDTDWLLSQFGSERSRAIQRYCQFVMAGHGLPNPMLNIRHQLLLGNDASWKSTSNQKCLKHYAKFQKLIENRLRYLYMSTSYVTRIKMMLWPMHICQALILWWRSGGISQSTT